MESSPPRYDVFRRMSESGVSSGPSSEHSSDDETQDNERPMRNARGESQQSSSFGSSLTESSFYSSESDEPDTRNIHNRGGTSTGSTGSSASRSDSSSFYETSSTGSPYSFSSSSSSFSSSSSHTTVCTHTTAMSARSCSICRQISEEEKQRYEEERTRQAEEAAQRKQKEDRMRRQSYYQRKQEEAFERQREKDTQRQRSDKDREVRTIQRHSAAPPIVDDYARPMLPRETASYEVISRRERSAASSLQPLKRQDKVRTPPHVTSELTAYAPRSSATRRRTATDRHEVATPRPEMARRGSRHVDVRSNIRDHHEDELRRSDESSVDTSPPASETGRVREGRSFPPRLRSNRRRDSRVVPPAAPLSSSHFSTPPSMASPAHTGTPTAPVQVFVVGAAGQRLQPAPRSVLAQYGASSPSRLVPDTYRESHFPTQRPFANRRPVSVSTGATQTEPPAAVAPVSVVDTACQSLPEPVSVGTETTKELVECGTETGRWSTTLLLAGRASSAHRDSNNKSPSPSRLAPPTPHPYERRLDSTTLHAPWPRPTYAASPPASSRCITPLGKRTPPREMRHVNSPSPRRTTAASAAAARSPSPESVNAADRGIAIKCVQFVCNSDFVVEPSFRSRIGFTVAEARHLLQALSATDAWTASYLYDAQSPSRTGPTTKMDRLVHNSMDEVCRGSCMDWGRWFGGLSRRRVMAAFARVTKHVEAMGAALDRNSDGTLVQLHSPRLNATPPRMAW